MKMKGFNAEKFDIKYKTQGGIREFIFLCRSKKTYRQIGTHFSMSSARVCVIRKWLISRGLLTDISIDARSEEYIRGIDNGLI